MWESELCVANVGVIALSNKIFFHLADYFAALATADQAAKLASQEEE